MFKVLITPLLNTFSIYSAKQIDILLTVQTSTQFDCYTCISWSRLFYLLTSWPPVFTEEVAFTVVHDGTGQRITHQSQVVKYNQVKFNIGGGYHKYSGCFVAPVKGTYVFFFSLEPYPGTKSSFVITVNDRGMLEGVSGAIHDEYNMSSNMVVVSLRKGDHVNVKTHPTWSVDPRQRLRYSGNSFSGFLLYPR